MAQKAKKIDYERRPSATWYRVVRVFFGLIFHTLWPLEVRGVENVPRKGAAVMVSNHLSLLDPFVVSYGANRLVSFMGKEELFRMPLLGEVMRKLGSFPVDRSQRDPTSMKIALTILKEGELLGMFPEGTRSTTGDMNELRTGAARLAARTKVPIVPVAVINTNHAMPPGKLLRPARIGVRFGEPFELTELYDKPKDEAALGRALETIKQHIAALQVE
ncbi:MAG: lysophospholipid acyltransferase family protein [Chloroflexota bacterium]